MGMSIDLKKTGIRHIIRVHGHLICVLLFVLSLLFLSSCSSSGGSEGTAENGAIAFSLKFPEAASSQTQQAPVQNSAVVSSACEAYGISTIEASIYDGETLIAQGGPWNCIDSSGLISDVAVGENRRIVILCYNATGTPIYSGERTGILVALGATTDAGVINVSSTNHAPVLSSIEDTSGLVGSLVVIDSSEFSATDADKKDSLTYDVGNSPEYDAAFDPGTRLFSWDPSLVDEYKVLFIVHDNGTPRKSDYEEVTIHINGVVGAIAPQFPVLDAIGSRVVNPGDIVSIQLHGSNPAGGSLTFSAASRPVSSTFNEVTGLFTWNTTSSDIGNHKIRFGMSNIFETDYEDVTITVGNGNRPPVLTPIGSRWTNSYETLSFLVTATDPEDDILTYSVIDPNNGEYEFPTGASIDPDTQIFTWAVGPAPIFDIFQVRIVVTDSSGETDYEDVLIKLPGF